MTVQLRDRFGNPVATPGISINLILLPAAQTSGTFTATTDATGLATFSNLAVNAAGAYQLLAESTNISSVVSMPFTISAGAATHILATGGTPQSALLDAAFANRLEATVTDAFGNPVSGATVTFAPPGSGASASLTAPTVTDANGRANVAATANATAGSYQVSASTGSITGATFALTNVEIGGNRLTFVTQPPTSTPAGQTMSPPIQVQLSSATGGIPGITVILSIPGSPGLLNGTLIATTDANGIAQFNNLSISVAGTYSLQATAGSLSVLSSQFQITASTGSTITAIDGGGQSAIVSTAYSAPLVALVRDSFNNPIAGASVTFAVTGSGAGATFSGPATVTTDANGIATSPGLTANATPGAFQVTASVTGAATRL